MCSVGYAEDIRQNMNLRFSFKENKNENPYCSQNYSFFVFLNWTPLEIENVCYYKILRKGHYSGVAYTPGSERIVSGDGCFTGGYPAFRRFVDGNLDAYLYNSTYQIIAVRSCYGLPNIYDEITTGDKSFVDSEACPSLTEQPQQEKIETVGEPINVANGNMFTEKTDIMIPAVGFPLGLSRTYNSQDNHNGQFGHGWRSNYDITLEEFPQQTVVETDASGVKTVYTWDTAEGIYYASFGKYSKIIRNADLTYTITRKYGVKHHFDAWGSLVEIEDRNGNMTTIMRNFDGLITGVSDSSGRSLSFVLDAAGKTTQAIDPAGRAWNYEYDLNENCVQVVDPNGKATTYQYDIDHNLVLETNANGNSLFFEYDEEDRAYHSWQDDGRNEVILVFDPDNQATVVTDSLGHSTHYEFNDYGLASRIIDSQGGIKSSTWDANLNKVSSTNENGHISNYNYDDRGNLLSLADPLGNITILTYEPNFDFVKRITDANGSVTVYDYDDKGNLVKSTDSLGYVSTNAYNDFGQLTSTTNAKLDSTAFTYDYNGNLSATMDALGNVSDFGYDLVGNLIQSTDAKGNATNFFYDSLNRLLNTTYPDESVIAYTYDGLDNKTSVTDNASNVTTYSYDVNNKVISVTNPLGYITNFQYDTEGNLIKVIEQNLNETIYQYDSLNRLISETNPLGLVKTFQYDAVGNRISETDASGNVTSYQYDALNQLKKINHSTSIVEFEYDLLGRRVLMRDNYGETTYSYDTLGRLMQVHGPVQDDVFQYTYDELGNRSSYTMPTGKTVTYGYDKLGRLLSITDSDNKTTTYTYDSVGNPLNLIYSNNIRTAYEYDSLNRLTRITNQNQLTQKKLSEFTYDYDLAGRRSHVTLLNGAIDYGYDALGQLKSESQVVDSQTLNASYDYDPAGNRISMLKNDNPHTYLYNEASQLLQRTASGPSSKIIEVVGSVTDAYGISSILVNGKAAVLDGESFSAQIVLIPGSNEIVVEASDFAGNTASQSIQVTYDNNEETVNYSYDNNGNLVSRDAQGQVTNFDYDFANRLTSVASSGVNLKYSYDGDGRRVSSSDGANVPRYLYDGNDVILENDSSGSIITQYLRNPYPAGGIGGIIHTKRGSIQEYYSYDGLGSTSDLTNSAGEEVESYQYDAFGNLLTQSTTSNNRNFLTKEQDVSGLVYFGARYYNPIIGRFITQDPSGMADGPNMYVYVGNDPVNYVDLWGWRNNVKCVNLICGGLNGLRFLCQDMVIMVGHFAQIQHFRLFQRTAWIGYL